MTTISNKCCLEHDLWCNRPVQPGDPIAQINPVEFQIAVDQALADYQQAGHAADAADVTTHYTTDDRKSMLIAAQATRAEAEQAVQAATWPCKRIRGCTRKRRRCSAR
jgi:multidrug resistance efflux pump